MPFSPRHRPEVYPVLVRVADCEVPLEGQGHDHEHGGDHGDVGHHAAALGERSEPLGCKND